jgi:hypothetical protein
MEFLGENQLSSRRGSISDFFEDLFDVDTNLSTHGSSSLSSNNCNIMNNDFKSLNLSNLDHHANNLGHPQGYPSSLLDTEMTLDGGPGSSSDNNMIDQSHLNKDLYDFSVFNSSTEEDNNNSNMLDSDNAMNGGCPIYNVEELRKMIEENKSEITAKSFELKNILENSPLNPTEKKEVLDSYPFIGYMPEILISYKNSISSV